MRRLLGVLRADQDEAPRAPQPGFAEVEALVETARAAGLEVAYSATGLPQPVDEAADAERPVDNEGLRGADSARLPTLGGAAAGLAAYRIIQEALANAARHAPGAPVTIEVRGLDDRLELTVRNPLTAALTPGRGHGLDGMRERAELLNGTLTAAPDDGDFVVRAVLPSGENQ